jgi:hypothetical protein
MKNLNCLLFISIIPLVFTGCKGGASKANQDTVF